MSEETDALEGEPGELALDLRALDAEMESTRKRMYLIRIGLEPVEDRDAELARLERHFGELGARFVETYRRWQESQREGDASTR